MLDFLGAQAGPDPDWPTAPPEEVGLDEARLRAALDGIEARRLALHGFLLVRHGRLVVERYGVAPDADEGGRRLGPDDQRHFQSTGKTFTSMLVGLALAEGRLPSVEAPVSTWFPDARGGGKERLTIAHLLTMRSGLVYSEGSEAELWDAPCVAEAYLRRPLAAAPGTRWNYSSADSQVLTEILRRTTGETPLEYARPRLFAPLGIERFHWHADRSGTHIGGGGMLLRPRDVARFAWMLCCRGRWNGAQVVPAAWIAEATRPWVTDHGHSSGPYGYQCWISRFGGFATRGYMGQNAYVLPELGLVAVFTAGLPFPECDDILDGVMTELVLPAVRG